MWLRLWAISATCLLVDVLHAGEAVGSDEELARVQLFNARQLAERAGQFGGTVQARLQRFYAEGRRVVST